MSGTEFTQHIFNGIALGSLYALIAIGYTMVYGILRLINFAHGEILMSAMFFAMFGVTLFSLPWPVAFLLAILLTAAFGISIERMAYRPLRNAPRISVLISAIGVSFLLQNLGLVVFGARPKAFPRPDMFNQLWHLGDVSVLSLNLYIPIFTVLLLIGLTWFINKTRTGMAMRAASKDLDTARLMGIDVDKIISITFGIGSALAAFGGIMWAMKYPSIHPLVGLFPGLKCFIAAVVGGIGNVPGAMLGGFILGVGEIMLVAFMPELSGYRDAFAFVLLIFILLAKPTGILGEKTAEVKS
ncbi:MAG: branched-chain amino acid ABC transporter permease [Firmicutes bacterium]|nr:branched-chain amino acid ABC transporter permease [Bacillota bacterium]